MTTDILILTVMEGVKILGIILGCIILRNILIFLEKITIKLLIVLEKIERKMPDGKLDSPSR